MRTRLFRGVVAGALVMALGAGLTEPAAADAKPGNNQVQVFDWIGTVIQLAGALLGGGGGGGSVDLDAVVRQIQAAIDSSRTELINHIDAIAAADVQACARSATIEFSDIDFMGPSVLQLWAQNATSCATRATSTLGALQSAQAVDSIGQVIGPLFAIVVAARTKARLTNGIGLVVQDEINAYQSVVAKDKAACSDGWGLTWWDNDYAGWHTDHWYTCTAFNGETYTAAECLCGQTIIDPIDYTFCEEYPMRNTARPIAQNALVQLRRLYPIM